MKFYHIKNLQSTKTRVARAHNRYKFYHIKNLQSTKTAMEETVNQQGFITLRIYKVLKHNLPTTLRFYVLSH